MTTGFDPYQPNIWVTPNGERASVTVQGVLVPSGTFTVERSTDGRSWTVIRGGTGSVVNNQFRTEDSEPPLGVDLLYRVTIDQDTPDIIERNYVTTPRVKRGIGSWVVAAPRTGTLVNDTALTEQVLQVSADAAGYGAWTVTRTNRYPDPRAVSTGTDGWQSNRGFGTGGAGTWSYATGQTGPTGTGITTTRRKTWTTAPTNNQDSGYEVWSSSTLKTSATVGDVLVISTYLRHSSATSKIARMRLQYHTATSGGSAVGTTTEGSDVTVPPNTWTRISIVTTVPSTAAAVNIFPDIMTGGGGLWAVGNTLDCTGLMVEKAGALGSYVDGALTDTASERYDWTGTVNASTSTLSVPADRNKLATVGLGTLAAGSYHVSGLVKYYDPNLIRWQELRDGPPARTWATVKGMTSWGTVRGATSSNPTPYGEVRVSLVNSGGTVVAGPVVAISPSLDLSQQWIEFNLNLTLAAQLTGGRLVVQHGDSVREYSATWWLTRFIVLPTAQVEEPYLHFFDGDWPAPADAEDYEWENGIFDSDSPGTIAWEGTAGNSTSIFTTPDVVYTIAPARVDPPDTAPVCDPVHLNLPIQPSMGQWFGLIKIGTLSHPGRASILEVIRRRPAIVVSDARGWERGEMTLLTRTLSERRVAIGIFAPGQIVQFRNPNPQYPEGSEGGPWYLGITDVNEERPFKDHRRPERYWSCTFVRVEKPVGLLDATVGTGSPWQHVKDTPTGQTWQGVRDEYANWADVVYRDVAPTDPGVPYAGGKGLPTSTSTPALAWALEELPS